MGLVAALAMVAPAPASAKPAKAELKRAKFHLGLGAKFFGQGSYAEALAEMRKAFAAVPLPATIFNMARCYQEMGQYAEAVEHFQRYMEQGDDAKKLKKTAAALAELIPKAFGSLEVVCKPAGARVTIAGVGEGECPYTNAQVRAGSWTLVATSAGHADVTQSFTVVPGERSRVDVTLQRPGRLTVHTDPAGADVSVNGQPAGKTPISEMKLDEGDHTLGFRLEGHRDQEQVVQVPAGEKISVAVTLARRGGALQLTSAPGGAAVLLDDEPLGSTPLEGLHLDEGEHLLRVEASMHVPWVRRVQVADGAAVDLHAAMPARWPTWALAATTGVAALAGGATMLGARSAYQERDDLLASYRLATDDAGRLGAEIRDKEAGADSLMLVSQVMFGLTVVVGAAAGWWAWTTPEVVTGPTVVTQGPEEATPEARADEAVTAADEPATADETATNDEPATNDKAATNDETAPPEGSTP